MKRVVSFIFVFLYLLVTGVITYCLLSYNSYNYSEIGDKIIYVAKKSNESYKKYDLLFIKKTDKYKVSEKAFYYYEDNKNVNIKFAKIKEIDELDENTHTFVFENGNKTSDEYMLGNVESTVSYGKIGFIYSILTSRWGYLLLIIFPMLVMFVFELYKIVAEIFKR